VLEHRYSWISTSESKSLGLGCESNWASHWNARHSDDWRYCLENQKWYRRALLLHLEAHIGFERERFCGRYYRIASVVEKTDITRPGYPFAPGLLGGSKTETSLNPETNSRKPLADQETRPKTIEVCGMTDNTLHNLLYYIYTGKVHLHLEPHCYGRCAYSKLNNGRPTLPTPCACPQVANAFELYRIAVKYGFRGLVSRCLHYLFSTVTPGNIYERLVSLWRYQDLREGELSVFYLDYLAQHFHVVNERDALISAICDDKDDIATKRLKEIMLEVRKRQQSG